MATKILSFTIFWTNFSWHIYQVQVRRIATARETSLKFRNNKGTFENFTSKVSNYAQVEIFEMKSPGKVSSWRSSNITRLKMLTLIIALAGYYCITNTTFYDVCHINLAHLHTRQLSWTKLKTLCYVASLEKGTSIYKNSIQPNEMKYIQVGSERNGTTTDDANATRASERGEEWPKISSLIKCCQ